MTKIRKLRVTLEGKTYDMVVEILDDVDSQTPAFAQRPAYTPPSIGSHAAAPAPTRIAAAAPTAAPSPTAEAAPSVAPGDVGAPVAGKVTTIHVAMGATVAVGDKLITMEAMKMFIDVCAPSSGTVAAINCVVGDVVGEGHPVVKLA